VVFRQRFLSFLSLFFYLIFLFPGGWFLVLVAGVSIAICPPPFPFLVKLPSSSASPPSFPPWRTRGGSRGHSFLVPPRGRHRPPFFFFDYPVSPFLFLLSHSSLMRSPPSGANSSWMLFFPISGTWTRPVSFFFLPSSFLGFTKRRRLPRFVNGRRGSEVRTFSYGSNIYQADPPPPFPFFPSFLSRERIFLTSLIEASSLFSGRGSFRYRLRSMILPFPPLPLPFFFGESNHRSQGRQSHAYAISRSLFFGMFLE